MKERRKYAAVGTGGRIPMFIDPIVDRYQGGAELVGLCDTSTVRLKYHQQRLSREYGVPMVPTYLDFDKMLQEQKPETVIVCTPDYLHSEYIIRSLDWGADVISEKPLTTEAEKFNEIQQAIARSGKTVRTAFNYRWTPGVSKVRELITAGEIGQVKHVQFEYLLNTMHGADYFRRWHSRKACSGGLLIHKATHHFDLINWWLNAIPSEVHAMGDLVFYGRKNAIARGQERWTRYARYTGVPEAEEDPFRLKLDADSAMEELYYKAEKESGYIRDQNVFRDDIDIEDSMSALIRYRTGAMANYSLNAYCPWEGYRVSLSGDGGRIEYLERHASHIITGAKDSSGDLVEHHSMNLRVQKLFSNPYEIEIPIAQGSHGGGDRLIQEQMFGLNPPADPLKRNAGHEQGGASILVGIAANRSIATGLPVRIDDLATLKPSATHLDELI